MDRSTLCKIIIRNRAMALSVSLVRREVVFEPNGNYVLVGVRQAGKSFLLYQRMQELLRQGHSAEELVYINFDDERLAAMRSDELDEILEAHETLSPARPILFLDEIQNIAGWEHFARRLANEGYRVYITGSNARMLSRDIATTLGGRFWTLKVFPYSLSEYLSAHGIVLAKDWQWGTEQGRVMSAAEQYMALGGFPELTAVTDKRAWLTGIYRKIFLGDIVVRNGVRNEEALRMSVRRLADCVRQPTSYNRLTNVVRSTGVKATVQGVIDYVRFMRESCLLFSIDNYASKFSEREAVKKHYFVDNGLLALFLTDQAPALLENLCAIHLYKRYGEELYYYNRNIEVDFFIAAESMAVQACYDMTDTQTVEREVRALEEFNKYEKCRLNIIVTHCQHTTLTSPSGLRIDVVPIHEWLLA